jgi:hypothetical protein
MRRPVSRAPGSALRGRGRDDRVLVETRILAAVVIPVLAVAAGILFLFPDDTERLWAWPIREHMSSFALAVPYAAGMYYFVRVLLTPLWHRVAAGLLPVWAFAATVGFATLLHWDRFTHDSPAFWLWAILYLTTPFVIPVVWWRNRATDPGTPEDNDVPVAVGARTAFLGLGVVQLAVAGFLFLFPATAIAVWPWSLTPLTARSTAGWWTIGLIGIFLWREVRWSGARVPVQAMLLGLALAVVSIVRAWDEFDTGRVMTWVFVTTLGLFIAWLVGFYAVMQSRSARAADEVAAATRRT